MIRSVVLLLCTQSTQGSRGSYESHLAMPRAIHEGVSCAPRHLYSPGEWHDPQIGFERILSLSDGAASEFEILGPVFGRQAVARPMPVGIDGPCSDDIAALLAHYVDVNRNYGSASPSYRVRIRSAVVWRNMVFVEAGGDLIPLYETFRLIDRHERGGAIAEELKGHAIQDFDGGNAETVFYGSVGSFNYGHWLVDDFARYAVLAEAGRERLCLFSSFDGAIDRIRQEGVALAAGPHARECRFVDREIPVRVRNLLYVTPCSEHPFVKNPQAMAYVRDLGRRAAPAAAPGRRLFVNRAERWPRHLSNFADLVPVLRAHGFEDLIADDLSLREQIEAFAGADIVAGIMGASMTSTIFCPPGTPLLYLAPSGWMEPFFWDAAAACGHPYHVLFGVPDANDPHHLYQKSFSVDPQALSAMLGRIAG